MHDPWAIETIALRKRYGSVAGLAGLDLRVPRGSVFGFLGRNGAGKTTTIKILLGMTRPDGGEARVLERSASDPNDSLEIRRRTAFVSEEKDLYEAMTVEEILRFTASFYPKWRADSEQRYLRMFDLPRARRVKELSKGMRTKLALATAFCRGADLLILDEPTSGLDPAMNEEVLRAVVAHVASEEATVFFSSHHIADVDQVADHVAIIDRGRTVVAGAMDGLRETYRRVHLVFGSSEQAERAFRVSGDWLAVRRDGRSVTVYTANHDARTTERLQALNADSMEVQPATLKEIFLGSTNPQTQMEESNHAVA